MPMPRTHQCIGIVFRCHRTMIRWVSISTSFCFTVKSMNSCSIISNYDEMKNKIKFNSNQSSTMFTTVSVVCWKSAINHKFGFKWKHFIRSGAEHSLPLVALPSQLINSTNLNECVYGIIFVISRTDIIIVMDMHRYRNEKSFRLFCFVLLFSFAFVKLILLSSRQLSARSMTISNYS